MSILKTHVGMAWVIFLSLIIRQTLPGTDFRGGDIFNILWLKNIEEELQESKKANVYVYSMHRTEVKC
jgi:hypothetical protein